MTQINQAGGVQPVVPFTPAQLGGILEGAFGGIAKYEEKEEADNDNADSEEGDSKKEDKGE